MPCSGAEPVEGQDSLYECIYCRIRGDQRAFNREHVLSEAFGSFKDALVLHQYVCRECNRSFGDGIERELTRDAFEAILRFQKGLKEPGQGQIKLRYVEFAVPEGNEWSGVRLHLAGNDGEVVFRPSPQVGAFDEATDRWTYLTSTEIELGLIEQYPHFKKAGGQLRVFAATREEHDLLAAKLANYRINYARAGDLQTPSDMLGTPENEVEVTFTLNTNIRRCIAKYAFNYLACVCNSRFALAAEFDAVRDFVRYGRVLDYGMVKSHFAPILSDDGSAKRQTDGHLITLSWDDTLRVLTCQVSIFNYITYDVVLCRELKSRLWRPIRSGHHYDLAARTVTPLVGIPMCLTV
jgi:hypothetical protein